MPIAVLVEQIMVQAMAGAGPNKALRRFSAFKRKPRPSRCVRNPLKTVQTFKKFKTLKTFTNPQIYLLISTLPVDDVFQRQAFQITRQVCTE